MRTAIPNDGMGVLYLAKKDFKNLQIDQASKVGSAFASTYFDNTLDAEARRRGIRKVGYGIRDTWVDPTEVVPEIVPMPLEKVNTRVTELAELHELDTQDLYALLEDAQIQQAEIAKLQEADCRRQAQMVETLRVMGDMR
nr:hypothetical protein [Tanacetum cinerariifolium]